jgi:hypothetical protein
MFAAASDERRADGAGVVRDFLNRVRVEKAKNLLGNPHLRVNEAAFVSY